ncbi:hypothetical protein BT96DRAFT_945738 [Gymnopus androsaceus JB14]|uniref:Uncharacterized protein n=1 Tax=Gymnopus androsaceus JB14 TaxID=1447944 RepID=A0A6A4H0S7_9AGAR|nr:hypothetical protein BT96DRAFT_945738 [Gymnopus androsaceus JB14]
MSSASSFQLTTDTFSPPIIDTFSPRVAPRPRVIPVYATSIPRRLKRSLSIHQTLHVKPIFHPYSRRVRSTSTYRNRYWYAPPSPQDSSVKSYKGATPPGSPLSELDDSINSLPGVCTILTCPTENITLHNKMQMFWTKLVHINHQDHWGADILLREQLKNKKDTLVKADKCWSGV